MNRLSTTKKHQITRVIITIAVLLLIVAGLYLLYAHGSERWPFAQSQQTSSQQTEPTSTVDNSPGATADQEAANKHKQQQYEQEQNNKNTEPASGTKQKVSVTITTYNQTESEVTVNGFVAGVVENDGTCTFTLTDTSGHSVSSSRPGVISGTNTSCGQSSIKKSQLHPGSWTAKLSYSSDDAQGETGSTAIPAIEVK